MLCKLEFEKELKELHGIMYEQKLNQENKIRNRHKINKGNT